MDHSFTFAELVAAIIGIGLTASFGAWSAVVRNTAIEMRDEIKAAVSELSKLREEIHRDRIVNERRFARLEQLTGLTEGD